MNKFQLALLLCCLTINTVAETLPESIKLATTDWCPYACEHEKKTPGMIHEFITKILKDEGINVTILFYPWSRSINLANSGKVDGLLTAVKSEAPSLLFTQVHTDIYQMCFFTKKTENWRFETLKNLAEVRIGFIQNYGYGEPIDSYLANTTKNVYGITAEGVPRLFKMLKRNRFDTFIDDEKVVNWKLKQDANTLRHAGCLAETPFYLALNPDRPWAKRLIQLLNDKIKDNRNMLKKIEQKYQ